MEKRDLRSLSYEELKDNMLVLNERSFRADQVYEWIHKKGIRNLNEMTNISKDLREKLDNNFYLYSLKTETVMESKKDGTRKYLFRLHDDEFVESVYMPYRHGKSVCISSQVGCRMGCRFCASTLDGLKRNLSAGEMLDQIYSITRDTNERISNVVVMGTGEPLDNYDELIRFIKMLTDERGLNISQRNVTVSTCGLVPEIKKLAEEDLKITLAISLHAATDEKRRQIMPIANKYSIDELMEGADHYFDKTGRRVTFEYSLIEGENDTAEDARRLSDLAAKRGVHVNLIPVNPVKERSFKRPDERRVDAFKNMLEKNRINVTIRRGMGKDIDGACGQLRRRHAAGLEDKEHTQTQSISGSVL